MSGPYKIPDEIVQGQLDEHKKLYEAGDKSQLIAAIRFCGEQKTVMPEWVVHEFQQATNNWYNLEVKELGAAFGLQWPKGAHMKAMKNRGSLVFDVLNRVEKAKNKGVPVDENLFSKIGKEIGLGKTLVSEYYYYGRKRYLID